LEDNFDFGRELKIRIRDYDGMYFIALTWYKKAAPTAAEVRPPHGWIMEQWRLDEGGVWQSAFYRAHE
jgi:hypothetical protein